MDKHSVHCVVPTLNSVATLEATLLSLTLQEPVQVKITVVDSGSTDDTLRLCEQWNVATAYVESGNIYRAINLGLRDSSAEWLCYLNSDDWLYRGSLARLIEYGELTEADVVYGNCDYVDGWGRFLYSFAAAQPEQLFPLFRCARMGFAQPAAIFRRSVYAELQGFAEDFSYKADADFFIRALQAGKRFAYVDGPAVACFRLHAQQLSNRKAEEIELEGRRLFGQPALQSSLGDKLTLLEWQIRNIPHYLLRVLRTSLLAKRFRAPRSLETYEHR